MKEEVVRSATMVVHTYKYMFREKNTPDGNIGIKFITDTAKGHDDFIKQIARDENIIQCVREYVSSYDCSLVGIVQNLKNQKEDKKDE